MRIALLTLEALASAVAVRRFVAENADRIALVALSDPFRPQKGGFTGQVRHLLSGSGLRLVPYLCANFLLPRVAGHLIRSGITLQRTKLAALCSRLGIPVVTVSDMNAVAFHDRLQASGADTILTFHCDQILTAETIAAAPCGGINVHPGLLPAHRGPVPTIHALLDNPPRFGVTVHRLIPRIDAGEILAQVEIEMPPGTTALAAAMRLHEAAVQLVPKVLDELNEGTATPRAVTPGAYCGFPSATQMRQLASTGRLAADWSDVFRALRTPA